MPSCTKVHKQNSFPSLVWKGLTGLLGALASTPFKTFGMNWDADCEPDLITHSKSSARGLTQKGTTHRGEKKSAENNTVRSPTELWCASCWIYTLFFFSALLMTEEALPAGKQVSCTEKWPPTRRLKTHQQLQMYWQRRTLTPDACWWSLWGCRGRKFTLNLNADGKMV